ncbi:MAG: type 4a pilus biogenesis protein PilO [Thermodesulforhabdaceae bacterium]
MKFKNDLAQKKEVIESYLKTLSNRKKIAILIGTVLIISGSFWYFIYQGNEKIIAQKTKEIEEARNRLDQLKRAEKMSKDLEKQLTEAEAKLQELLVFLPDIREIPSILENISGLGGRVGLKQLILFEPKGEELREYHAAILIHLTMLGDYNKVGMFFDELAHTQRVLKVRDFTMKRKGNGEVDVDCMVETYRYVEKPPEQPKGKKK